MSDLFKDHGPELSDDEDRRLWQRVRTIPEEAAPPRLVEAPWWTRLWAMPAVRYGAPALAVLLVAVVWVTERRPEPPARVAAARPPGEPDRRLASSPSMMETPKPSAPAPRGEAAAPKAERRDELAKESRLLDAPRSSEVAQAKDQAAARAENGAVLEREVQLKAAAPPPSAAPAPTSANETSHQKFAGAPTAPARDEEAVKTPPVSVPPAPSVTSSGGTMSSVRGGRSDELKMLVEPGAGERLAAGTLPAPEELARHEILSDVLNPAHGGNVVASVILPKGAPWAPPGWKAGSTVLVMSGENGATGMDGQSSRTSQAPVAYGEAPARSRVAVLAYLFEKSLAAPERGRLEALRKAAQAIDPALGGYGRSRLLTLLDGALGATPAR